MAALALLFAVLGVAGVAIAVRTGSIRALALGLAGVVIGLVAFCIWAWSL